jgi:hypothetical protein
MANVVVTTSGTNSIVVDFGAYYPTIQYSKMSFDNRNIIEVGLESDRVEVTMEGQSTWHLAYTTTTGCYVVDSVAGVAPTSNSDLFDKITALRG